MERRMTDKLEARQLVTALKAAAEPTRLRILALVAAGELTVKDLTQILGQSQPRISRHLKLLAEAGLLERFREGSWVYFHLSERSTAGQLAMRLLTLVRSDEPTLERDRERAEALKKEREARAHSYFETHAADWDRIRSLHVAEREVEAAMRAALGPGPFELLVDAGTGTGRMLELFADTYAHGLGFDLSQSMLAYARAKLAEAGITKAQLRHGDLYGLALADRSADAVVMHQVLHYLSEPQRAIREAARLLRPGGRLLIVDFAPHELEFLREQHAHERLGFATAQVSEWLAEAGLEVLHVESLAPTAKGPEALTVTLWVARNGAAAERSYATRPAKALERTS
jgi:ArsR family transcriptional regulator